MSDFNKQSLTINTNSSTTKIYNHKPIPIFSDNLSLLSEVMPPFNFSNPICDPIELIGSLKVTMKLYGGIGLAANQCGIPTRCFVVNVNDEVMAFFNPRITEYFSGEGNMDEGCLSFPGLCLNIKRPLSFKFQYENENGITMVGDFSGIAARCFLHELDHLNGIKFTSHVGKTSLMMAKKKQKKLIKFHKKVART